MHPAAGDRGASTGELHVLERRQPRDPDKSQASTLWSRRRRSISLALGAVALLTFFVGGSFGASVVSTSLSGGSGTASFGGTFYAAQDALLTLHVTRATNPCKCLARAGRPCHRVALARASD